MERKLFNATSADPVITPIPEGCADIARALGYKPADTIWDYGTVYSAQSGIRFTEAVGVVHEGITTLIRGEANGATLKLHKGFLEYQQKYAGVTNVIEVTDKRAKTDILAYPQHSIPRQLAEKLKGGLKKDFNNAVICSLFAALDVQEVAAEIGGRTLISAAQADLFNSKVRVVTEAEGKGYNVAPFVVARKEEELEAKMKELYRVAADLGLEPDRTKYWVKFDNLAGGQGVMPYTPSEASFSTVKDWIRSSSEAAGLAKGQFLPIIMDIDVGHLPDVKQVLTNLNIQAIVGPDKVSVTGTTFQKTEGGHYVGGAMPRTAEEKAWAKEGRRWALPVLEAAQKAGYRGYAGIDLLLCEDQNGQARGYVLEMNARLNSSTSLLSATHWVARESGIADPAACNFSSSFSPMKDFRAFRKAFESVLYKGSASGYEGIIPIIMRPDGKGDIKGVKTISVAPDAKRLASLEQRYHKIVQRLT